MRVVSFLPGLTSLRPTGEGVSETDFEEFRVVVTPRKTWEGGVSGRGWERWGVGEMDSIASSQSSNGLRSGDVHVKGMEMKKNGEEAVVEDDELRKYLTDSILYSSRESRRACPDGFDSKPKLHDESFCELQLFRETFQNFLRKSLHDSFSVAVQQPESIGNHEEGDFMYRSASQRVDTDPVRQSMTMAMISRSMLCKTVADFENKVSSRVRTGRQNKEEKGEKGLASQLASDVQNTRITEKL